MCIKRFKKAPIILATICGHAWIIGHGQTHVRIDMALFRLIWKTIGNEQSKNLVIGLIKCLKRMDFKYILKKHFACII